MKLEKKDGVIYKITRTYSDGAESVRYAQAISSPQALVNAVIEEITVAEYQEILIQEAEELEQQNQEIYE